MIQKCYTEEEVESPSVARMIKDYWQMMNMWKCGSSILMST